MADSITWLLNADASQVRAEMNAAVAAVNTGTNGMVGGFTRAELAHGSFLKSNAKVAHQVENVAHSMLYGADSTQVMVTAMEGLGRAVKLPLLPLASLFIGATAIKSVYDYRQEWAKLNAELDKVNKRPPGRTASEIEKDVTARATAIEKTTDKIESESWWGKAKRWAGNLAGALLDTGGNSRIDFRGGPNQFMRGQRAPVPEIHDPKAEAEKKIEEARKAQAKDAEELARLEHEKVVKAQADKFKESLQFSLADIAKEGRKRKTGTFDSDANYYGDVAQKALDEQMAARKAMMAGHFEEGIQHQSNAEQLKSTLPQLKDSDKISAQLTVTNQTLREIREKVTFTNQ